MKVKPGTPLTVALAFDLSAQLPVGRLAIERGRAVLDYNTAFIASGLTLNPFLPLRPNELEWAKEPTLFQGLHGIFADSLPDAWGDLLVRRRAQRARIDYASLTALDRLAIVGSRGMGALVYEPKAANEKVGAIDLDVLAREAGLVLEGQDSAVLPQLERLGGSSGGARPKVLIAINTEGQVIAGDEPPPPGYEAWLVKLRGSRHDVVDIGPLEAAYADMARACGLDVSPTRLIQTRGGPGYFATRRFDRGQSGTRVHVASVAGLLDTDWTTPTIDYDTLLRLTRRVTRDQRAVERMFLRMVFNIAAHNRDDHAKQHAFLMDDTGRWTLAPPYDLTFSRGPGGEHYLAVGGHGGDDIAVADIVELGKSQDIGEQVSRRIIDQVCDVVCAFPAFARTYGLSSSTLRATAAVLDAGLNRLSRRLVRGISQADFAEASSGVESPSHEELAREEETE